MNISMNIHNLETLESSYAAV